MCEYKPGECCAMGTGCDACGDNTDKTDWSDMVLASDYSSGTGVRWAKMSEVELVETGLARFYRVKK